jgi:hypothetical protein
MNKKITPKNVKQKKNYQCNLDKKIVGFSFPLMEVGVATKILVLASINPKIVGEAARFMTSICGIMKTDCIFNLNAVKEI